MSHVVYEARHAFPEATVYPRSQEHSFDDYPDAYSVRGRVIPQSAAYRVEGGQPAVRFWTKYQGDSLPKMGLNLGEALIHHDLPWLLNNRHPVRFHEPKIRILWPGMRHEWSEVIETPGYPQDMPLCVVANLVASSIDHFLKTPRQSSSPEYTLPNAGYIPEKLYLVELRRFEDDSWQPVLSECY